MALQQLRVCAHLDSLRLMMCFFMTALMLRIVFAQNEMENKNEMTSNSSWRDGYDGHGTTHEQMGQPHWPPPQYTPYTPYRNFSKDSTLSSNILYPIFKLSHFVDHTGLTGNHVLPPGYVVVKNGNTLHLGPKFDQNQWGALLAKYWLVWFAVIFLITCIVLVPFIAVCYCCLCCCRRKQGCPPCTASRDFRQRCCCGICLLFLIFGLIFGLLVAFVANKLLEKGFEDSSAQVQRGTEDTCIFLKDVSDHVYHIMVHNYEELETHINFQLENAHLHMFLDLTDTSNINALQELERIMENMPLALKKMKRLASLESQLRFLTSEYRDGLRGIKRDIMQTLITIVDTDFAFTKWETLKLNELDLNACLHVDKFPDTKLYVQGIQEIIDGNLKTIANNAMARLKEVNKQIQTPMSNIIPVLQRDLNRGQQIFTGLATNMRNLIDAVISDIHMNTLRSSKTYDDVYERFGPDRRTISFIIFILILLIIIVLIVSLLCGCIGTSRSAPGPSEFCSKGMGASCLLTAILIIFGIFSFIALVGLFYLILGVILYGGACAPLKNMQKNGRELDTKIDLNRYLSGEKGNSPPLRISSVIGACQANKNIFHILRANNLYDIGEIKRANIFSDQARKTMPGFKSDLSKIILTTENEKTNINQLRFGNLSSYHSKNYESVCSKYTPINYKNDGDNLSEFGSNLKKYNDWYQHKGKVSNNLYQSSVNLKAIDQAFTSKISKSYKDMLKIVKDIDKLILYEGRDFNNTISSLVQNILRSERFLKTRGKDFINDITSNFSVELNEMQDKFINKVINECNNEVGRCKSLEYIYYQGAHFICKHLVDPINAFWLGILLCALFLLPIIFVAHRLMCLYLIVYPEECCLCCPIGSGAAYVAPRVYRVGQQAHYVHCLHDDQH